MRVKSFVLVLLDGSGVYMMASDKRRDTQEYWDARLARMNLGTERGRPTWLDYGYRVNDLDFDGVRTYSTANEIEDRQEWPISLL